MKQKIFYKVVRVKGGGNFVSARSSLWQQPEEFLKLAVLKYKIGKKTIPAIPHSKIMVFNTLEEAKIFKSYSAEVILEVMVVNPRKASHICYSTGDVEEFWILKKRKKNNPCSSPAPKGTYFVDSVIPVRLVDQ